jgi:hypothetical protein
VQRSGDAGGLRSAAVRQRWATRGLPVLVAVAVALALALAGCGGGTSTVTASGWVTFSEEMHQGVVSDPVIAYPNGGTRECGGTGKYSDLVEGESIIIRNADGAVVGSGQLKVGRTTFADAATGTTRPGAPQGADPGITGTISCSLPFTIPDVDDGSVRYTVAIGDRVPLERVKRADLTSMVLAPRG